MRQHVWLVAVALMVFSGCNNDKGGASECRVYDPNNPNCVGQEPVCGNGQCETGESTATCPQDCPNTVCGNGVCEAGETTATCPQDCPNTVCGNGVCEAGETNASCPADCPITTCGNGVCDAGEDTSNCPTDCTAPVCGNGNCEPGEDQFSCPQDCSGTCGDGVCQAGETVENCSVDCGSCVSGTSRLCGVSNLGICRKGEQYCVNGEWGPCEGVILPEATEVCDGLDNDCDGLIDNGPSCPCIIGSERTCGTSAGICEKGYQVCEDDGQGNTRWSQTCIGAVGPQPETCNGLDDDCNGVADDAIGCQCTPGSSRVCGSNVGECRQGVQSCITTGIWDGVCVGEVGPIQEVCDGLDNDCNGLADDAIGCQCDPGSTRVCGSAVGECQPGVQSCTSAGVWDSVCVGEVGPSQELCDNLDNDCNGVADDSISCQCDAGDLRPCGNNVGECSYGTQICLNSGIWDSNCQNEVLPSSEVCNGLDNDCNGTPDDGIGCQCQPNESRPCGNNVGECSFGTQTCDANGLGWGTCNGQVLPSPELCDGLDNDCNGLIDDAAGCQCTDGSTRVCGVNIGACNTGEQTCANGVWGTCVGETVATTEVCDGVDNDCNGLVDEGVNCQCQPGDQQPCGTNIGACQSGLQDCISDGQGGFVWSGICNGAVWPTAEVCDNVDNDCNGSIDDGILCQCSPGSTKTCGVNIGACTAGTQTCQPDYTWGPCAGATWPSPEVCDNIDNDCNGAVDDNILCECPPGSVRPCGSNQGTCVAGTQTCLPNYTWDVCVGAQGPTQEVCDNLDNDCNGLVDDAITCQCQQGSTRTCGSNLGTCFFGTQQCLFDAGTGETYWEGVCNGQGLPVGEVCDGLDNDCNGAVDDGILCQCQVGSTRLCGSALGECVPGAQTCLAVGNETMWGPCVGAVLPTPELCNGLDDDCNGAIDDAIGCVCIPGEQRMCGTNQGACRQGTQTCNANGLGWGACNGAIMPSPEVCNGLDDDCNGVVDDGRSCQCNPGDQRVCGSALGSCRQGVQLCVLDGITGDSYWDSTCVGEVLPTPELCNGLDDDCNGAIDDAIGCVCIPGEQRMCGTNQGACRQGTQTCNANGLGWGACNGAIMPTLEICDGIDNDCNGLVDEGIACACQPGDQAPCGSNVGECQMGLQDCVSDGMGGYVWSGICVGNIGPSPEVCDNLDNDCNGLADDAIGCQCIPGESRNCGLNVGRCSYGTQVCNVNGTWNSVCTGAIGPTNEVCNGLDDDCNGSVDDGLFCQCVLGSVQPCGSSVGTCVQGTQTCMFNAGNGETYWDSVCVGAIGPTSEVCDGLDNDCNGAVDENCQCTPGNTRICGSSVGQCSFGVQTCQANGTWGGACVGQVLPSAEVCDGVDNDCNGTIDEGCQCLNGSSRPCGSSQGECVQGTQTCSGGVWGLCVGQVGPQPDGPPAGCDGLDNDCNGIIDDACGCQDGDTAPCGTDQGECVAGTSTCNNGVWGACVGYIGPQPEICGDLLDQNCNGIADDPGVCPP